MVRMCALRILYRPYVQIVTRARHVLCCDEKQSTHRYVEHTRCQVGYPYRVQGIQSGGPVYISRQRDHMHMYSSMQYQVRMYSRHGTHYVRQQ